MYGQISQMAGIAPELRAALISSGGLGLPVIRGDWYTVDPYKVTAPDGGIPNSFASIEDAYDACVSGYGDGIVVFSGGTTAAHTTSEIHSELDWTKHNITVVGIGAPTRMYQRARINNVVITSTANTIAFASTTTITDTASGFLTAGFKVGDIFRVSGSGSGTNNGTGHIITAVAAGTITCAASTFTPQTITETGTSVVLATYCSSVITVSGNNNRFFNLFINNEDTDALALNALKVSGHRNYFENIHAANGLADAATTLTRSLWLSAAQENTFVNCTFGTDTVDRGNNATYDILISGACARNRFYGCETIRMTTVGVANFAVYLSATTGGRPTRFHDCVFSNWSTASGNAVQTAAFGYNGAGNDDIWWTGNTCAPGYGSTGLGGYVWVQGANIAAGVGGVLTTQS
jgi:hypothetical protein